MLTCVVFCVVCGPLISLLKFTLDVAVYFVSFLHEVAIGITNSAYRGTRNIYASLRTSYNSAICLIMLPKGSYLHSADATTTPIGSFRRGHWMLKTTSSGALMPCHCIFVSNIVICTHLAMKLVVSTTIYYYNFPVDT